MQTFIFVKRWAGRCVQVSVCPKAERRREGENPGRAPNRADLAVRAPPRSHTTQKDHDSSPPPDTESATAWRAPQRESPQIGGSSPRSHMSDRIPNSNKNRNLWHFHHETGQQTFMNQVLNLKCFQFNTAKWFSNLRKHKRKQRRPPGLTKPLFKPNGR